MGEVLRLVDGVKVKRCTKCRETKEAGGFHKRKSSKDGYNTICKICKNTHQREYCKANRVKIRANHKKWRDVNQDKIKQWGREYDKKNKESISERKRIYHSKNIAERAESQLKLRYGMTQEDWDALYNKQNGCCAICGIHQSNLKTKLFVDHCHITDHIRGLLCGGCNSGLGFYKDNVNSLLSAIDYLLDRWDVSDDK